MERLNWNDLRVFLAVARGGGLSRAGRTLGVSQSTAGRRIDALESALGSRLFERRATGYRLTEAGSAMLSRAEAIEPQLLDLESEIGGRDVRPTGRVRITSVETLATQILIPALERFRRCFPALHLELAIQAARSNLPERTADIALRLSRPESGSFSVRKIATMGFGLYGARRLFENRPRLLDGHALDTLPLVGWPADLSYVAPAEALRGWTGVGQPSIGLDTIGAQTLAARAGLGLAVLPCLTAGTDGDLVRVASDRFHLVEDLWMVVPEDLRQARRIRVTCDFILETVAHQRSALAGEAGGVAL